VYDLGELARRRVSLVTVDAPELAGLFPSLDVVTNPDLIYVRFHVIVHLLQVILVVPEIYLVFLVIEGIAHGVVRRSRSWLFAGWSLLGSIRCHRVFRVPDLDQ
jgi:hypothetical protein